VAVDARGYKPGEVLRVKELWNFTTRSFVRARGSGRSRVFDPLVKLNEEKYDIIRGHVVALQQRQDRPGVNWSPIVWSFRLQRNGPNARPLPPVDVELRGHFLRGSLVTGDEVELDASGFNSGDVVSVRKLRNLTANTVVKVS
jgi:hypothetical protein